jgi:hypothetical protein
MSHLALLALCLHCMGAASLLVHGTNNEAQRLMHQANCSVLNTAVCACKLRVV